jgi:hypothetical protein
MGIKKELHFFDRDVNFEGAKPAYDRYHRFFDGPRSVVIRGDATPGYIAWPDGPERMRAYNSKMKMILLMRNPVARAFSDWNLSRVGGAESLSFSEAIRSPKEAVRLGWPYRPPGLPYFHYVDRGLYAEQIENLWRYFPREQTLALKTEDLQANPAGVLARICDFLEVERYRFSEPERLNARDYPHPMSSEDQAFLQDLYEPDIARLEKLLGWDCSDWRTRQRGLG